MIRDVSPFWIWNSKTVKGSGYPKNTQRVAWLMVQAGDDDLVSLRDGNPLNLVRGNLKVAKKAPPRKRREAVRLRREAAA